jgi:hypothetical protein
MSQRDSKADDNTTNAPGETPNQADADSKAAEEMRSGRHIATPGGYSNQAGADGTLTEQGSGTREA